MKIRAYRAEDESAVVDLWRHCDLVRPQNDPHADIRRKLAVAPELFVVGDLHGEIVATVMAGYDGHRGWINYLAVSPQHRHAGYGRKIMEHAERLLLERGCPKINLQIRSSNQSVVNFYHAIGFTPDDVMSMGKRLIVDAPPSPTLTTTPSPPTPAPEPAADFYCAQVIPGRVEVRKIVETDRVLAFHHTQPYWPVHIVIVPKKHIASLADVAPDDWPIVQEMLTIASDLSRQITAEHGGCRLSTNSGDHQSTKHLHFYIHSGPRIRDEQGVPIDN